MLILLSLRSGEGCPVPWINRERRLAIRRGTCGTFAAFSTPYPIFFSWIPQHVPTIRDNRNNRLDAFGFDRVQTNLKRTTREKWIFSFSFFRFLLLLPFSPVGSYLFFLSHPNVGMCTRTQNVQTHMDELEWGGKKKRVSGREFRLSHYIDKDRT